MPQLVQGYRRAPPGDYYAVTLRIDAPLYERICRQAAAEGVSKRQLVNRLLRAAFDRDDMKAPSRGGQSPAVEKRK